jgi:hypothetical protein
VPWPRALRDFWVHFRKIPEAVCNTLIHPDHFTATLVRDRLQALVLFLTTIDARRNLGPRGTLLAVISGIGSNVVPPEVVERRSVEARGRERNFKARKVCASSNHRAPGSKPIGSGASAIDRSATVALADRR